MAESERAHNVFSLYDEKVRFCIRLLPFLKEIKSAESSTAWWRTEYSVGDKKKII